MEDFFGFLKPLEIAVAWIMVRFHDLLTAAGMPSISGWTWALSIVGLVIVIRILLIPLFVKQIRASRGMQLIQPDMRKLQAKYKNKKDPASRQAMQQEMMALYKREGTNPFASCLPILLQMPIFFSLFRVLNYGIRREEGVGALTPELARQAGESTLFGAKLTDTFLGSGELNVQVVTVILIIAMSASTFLTQKQLMTKNMPAAALDGPFAQQQKLLLYAFPLIFAVTGVNFPIGVLLYWLTTNVWSMGQQFYVIRRMPAPGSAAEKALLERRRRKAERKGTPLPEGSEADATPESPPDPGPVKGQRQQPKRKDRQKRRGTRPGGDAPGRAPGTPRGGGKGPGGGPPPRPGTSDRARDEDGSGQQRAG